MNKAQHRAEVGLFADLAAPSKAELREAQTLAALGLQTSAPRLREANRDQVELQACDLESLLDQGHRARLVWGYVVLQDLSPLIDAIKARGSNAGRAAIDPRILFALWLYAVLDNVSSGRELERLSRSHDAYRWICGGVPVNYHVLNDFRANNVTLMDSLLTANVAALASVGAIRLGRVAQDGMRVRANAGAASFRRKEKLEKHLRDASELVQSLKEEAKADPARASRRKLAAQQRAVQEREQRIKRALAQLPEVEAVKRRNGEKAEDARVSTTDGDARRMKMGDGGFRPAYNVQFATDCETLVIVGTKVVTAGSDFAQLTPMVEQVTQRTGTTPAQWLVDGGFPSHEQVDAVAEKTELYAPVPQRKVPKIKGKGKAARQVQQETKPGCEFDPMPGDSAAVVQWRQRMGTEEAQAIYRQRAATAECVNAHARNRGLLHMPVRGLVKAACVVTLYVLAHNLMRTAQIAPQLVGRGTPTSSVSTPGR